MSFRFLLLWFSVSVRVSYMYCFHSHHQRHYPYWRFWGAVAVLEDVNKKKIKTKHDLLLPTNKYMNKYFVQSIFVLSSIRRARLGPWRAISAIVVSPGGVCQASLFSTIPAFPISLYSDITFSLQSQWDCTYQKPWLSSAPLQGFIGDAQRTFAIHHTAS